MYWKGYILLYVNFTSVHLTEKRKPHPQRETVIVICLCNEILVVFVVTIFSEIQMYLLSSWSLVIHVFYELHEWPTQDIFNLIPIFLPKQVQISFVTCNKQSWVVYGCGHLCNCYMRMYEKCHHRGIQHMGAEGAKWLSLGIWRIDSNWAGLEDFLQLESRDAYPILWE